MRRAIIREFDQLGEMLSNYSAMFDESTLLSRKVKEVALANKQKERDFVHINSPLAHLRS